MSRIKVVVTDTNTGETDERIVPDGDYVIICAEPCHLASVQAYPMKGTHVLTVKGKTSS